MTRRSFTRHLPLMATVAALGAAASASTPDAADVAAAASEPPVPAGPALRIVDTGNETVVIRGASIDYGGLFSDAETTGIRAQLGEGTVTIRWTDVQSVTLVPKSNAAPQLDVTLRNGERASATLIRKGRMMLSGRSDLGNYTIEVEKIRTITPVGAPAPTAR